MQNSGQYILLIVQAVKFIPADLCGMVRRPVKRLQELKKRSLSDVLIFLLITGVLYSAALGIVTYYGFDVLSSYGFLAGYDLITLILLIYLLTLGGTFFNVLFIHIFVIIVEGRYGLSETFKVVSYSMTPTLLLGWIPVAGVLVGIWSIVLETLAIRELHEISSGRAILAMILPYIMFASIFISLIFIPAPYPILS